MIRRVKYSEPDATSSDVEKICGLLATLLEEQPKLAKRLLGDQSAASTSSAATTASESVQMEKSTEGEEYEKEKIEINNKKDKDEKDDEVESKSVKIASSELTSAGAGRSRRMSDVLMCRVPSDRREAGYKEEIIGCRVVVKGCDEEWYDGVVASYHPAQDGTDTGYHHVVFGDGIEATLDLQMEEMYISEE